MKSEMKSVKAFALRLAVNDLPPFGMSVLR